MAARLVDWDRRGRGDWCGAYVHASVVTEVTRSVAVNLKKEGYDVYIGRPSKWGNPFVLRDEQHREALIGHYKKWLLNQPQLLADLRELKGKRLGCYCAPKLCHGNILAEMANALPE
jgi:hypothetical protein